jgi:hypothetical protein
LYFRISDNRLYLLTRTYTLPEKQFMRSRMAYILWLLSSTFRLKGISKPGIWKPVIDKNLNILPLAS